ncbi:Leucine-rich repeat [Sesbania bispinosa]|nr:Leucine-rich repeat [Sesbania bispinosa]
MEYYELAKKMVDYAKGVPLVLKVLGHLLHGKVNDIKRLLKDRQYSVTMGLERLKDKTLITISQENIVSMHDLIQEMALEIVREESIEDPGRRSRLLDPEDIYEVLKYNKGSEAIRSMVVNMTIIKQLQLSPQVFDKMSNLQFLDIYAKGSHSFIHDDERGLYLPQGLESLPNELRYLRWAYYPLESLPSKFSAEKLVVLILPHSRVKKLWHQVQDLVNLNVLVLCSSTQLMELPDFSKATSLKVIDLRHCVGLTSVHPSVLPLNKLEKLDLSGCISLTSLQSNTHLSSLRSLSLCGCTALKEFSVTSENMIQLNLEHTGIKQLPSSIGLQSKLEKLHLGYTNIDNLPESIKHLTKLRHLDLQHCKELQTLPELPSSLETLNSAGCVSLETVMFPSTAIEKLKENKRRVEFWNCLKLDEHSLRGIELNAQINMMRLAHQHVTTSDHDYDAQDMYVYPGSKVPKWLEYSTTHDHLTIDLSSAPYFPQLGFIFCFIIPAISSEGLILKFKISDVGEDESIKVYLDRPRQGIELDHVYLMYHQGCSHFLSSRANDQPKITIKVTGASRTLTSSYVPVQLKGFGVSLVTPSKYHQFIQQMELGDSSIFSTMCSVEDEFQYAK